MLVLVDLEYHQHVLVCTQVPEMHIGGVGQRANRLVRFVLGSQTQMRTVPSGKKGNAKGRRVCV